jgi:hypothetical protein
VTAERKKAVSGGSTGSRKGSSANKKRITAREPAKKAATRNGKKTARKTATGTSRTASGKGSSKKGVVTSVEVEAVVDGRPASDLADLFLFWSGRRTDVPDREGEVRAQVVSWMAEPDRVADRVAGLGRRLGSVLEVLLGAPGFRMGYEEIAASQGLAYLSTYDLEACLSALQRRCLILEGGDPDYAKYGARSFVVPPQVASAILRQRRARARGVFDLLTLRGHMDRLYTDPERAAKTPPRRQREMYKLYSKESAAVARIERLPEGIRELVEKAILEFGGILPRSLFERMETELPHWNGRRWRLILEQSLIGTVRNVDLSRYGILHDDETLVVFNEVALAWLKHVAVPGDPDAPHEELSLGIDLVSNLARFLGIIDDNTVRFTQKGEIFKTTEKKIVQQLIPNPGRELSREEVLSFIFRFCRNENLIANTGERTFAVSQAGREWGERDLATKLGALVDFSVDERALGGEPFHQERMRGILLRLLKRVEAGTWYDIMYLPFLARNTYLASMDELDVEEYFEERSKAAHYTPMVDPQRMAWNLVRWVRQRLYLLGIVDLGYDAGGRPVAMRLTLSGARLLGISDEADRDAPALGTLVVTPDFEVVMFPTGDDAEILHDLDRFCVRERQGHLVHFRIEEGSVRSALKGGMSLAAIVDTLERHSRTPVPQNVMFSIRDWALRAGLVTVDDKLVARCEDPDTMRRFMQDPGVRAHLGASVDDVSVKLSSRASKRRLVSLLRDLGFLVEAV